MSYLKVIAALGLLVLSSKIELDVGLPYMSFSLQSLVLIMLCPALGVARCCLIVISYLLMGWAGLPVFSSSPGGVDLLQSPGLGYLLGFLPAALIPGHPVTWWRSLMEMMAAHVLILLCGSMGLVILLDITISRALIDGALVFTPGAMIKSVLGATLVSLLARWT